MKQLRFTANVQLPHPATIFAISMQGVLPLSLIGDMLLVVDRNLLSKLKRSSNSDSDRYWISMLDSPAVLINPIFSAMEGSARRLPSREEFVEGYFSAEEAIRATLPKARLIAHTPESVSKSYALVEDLLARRDRELAFLVQAAPLVAVRCATKDLAIAERKVLSLAESLGHTGGSLCLLVVLSCLYESADAPVRSPGRGVLKPKGAYSLQDAHNCLSDLLALELLIVAASLGIGEHAFVTSDKRLAVLWQALDAVASDPVGGKGSGKFRITDSLLQRIDDAGLSRLEALFSAGSKLIRPNAP